MTSQYFGSSTFGGTIGGYRTLDKYHESVLSREKDTLIRGLAADLSKALKFSVADKDSTEKLISILKTKIPNPKSQTIKNVSSAQSEICKTVARVMNNRYGRKVVDESATPSEICEQVSELMYSLFSGLNSEFVAVTSDVKKIITNINILRNTLQSAFEKLINIINQSTDEAVRMQSDSVKEIYNVINTEINRQESILASIIGTTIDPTTKLIGDMNENDIQYRNIVHSLKAELGTKDLSRKMTYMLSGISSVAQIADTIDKALKKIGMSVQDYKKSKNVPEFLESMRNEFERKYPDPSSEDLAKFIAILQIVKSNDYAHDDIVKHLNKKGGHREENLYAGVETPNWEELEGQGYSSSSYDDSEREGGAIGEYSLGKRIKRQRVTREVLFKDFEMRLEQQYKKINEAVEKLAKRMGHQIPLDEALHHFIRCMEDLGRSKGIDREKYYLALSGYQEDPLSKEERAHFLGQLDAVSRSLKPLVHGPAGELFSAIKQAVDQTIGIIDSFKEKYLKPLTTMSAIGQTPSSSVMMPTSEVDTGYADASFGGDSNSFGGDSNSFGGNAPGYNSDFNAHASVPASNFSGGSASDTYVTLEQATRHIKLYYNAARAKHNLTYVASDIKEYSTSQNLILGDAIGSMTKSIKEEYEAAKKEIEITENPTTDSGRLLKRWLNPLQADVDLHNGNYPHLQAGNVAELKKMRQGIHTSVLSYLHETANIRITLLKTAEAIEVYLTGFANAIATNPDEVKHINALLKAVDVVAKWYTDRSGNTITEFLEMFPSTIIDGKEIHNTTEYKHTENHYYEWVKNISTQTYNSDNAAPPPAQPHNSNYLPANPFLGMLPASKDSTAMFTTIMESAKKAASSVRVLDNIISAFVKLGNQYGKENLTSGTFMSPGVILNNLRRYMFHSSIVMGVDEVLNVEYKGADLQSLTGVDQKQHNYAYSDLRSGTDMKIQSGPYAGPAAVWIAQSKNQSESEYKRLLESKGPLGNPGDPWPLAAPGAAAAAQQVSYGGCGCRGGCARCGGVSGGASTPAEDAQIVEKWARGRFTMAFSSITDSGKAVNGFKNTWAKTDEFFIMTIKSMIAKIFTTIGTYSIFNKPTQKNLGYNNTRAILGGSNSFGGVSDDIPHIEVGAAELYARLPLFAELYRDIFDFEDVSNENPANDESDGKKISLVPEFDGRFSNFVKIIFDEAKYVVESTYTEHHAKKLIREINDIWKYYRGKNPKITTHEIISEFAKEVNRRYGVVKKSEIDAYLKNRRRYDAVSTYSSEEKLDFNILGERDQEGRGPAPSDRYDHSLSSDIQKTENPYSEAYNKLVRTFRERFDKKIRKVLPTSPKKIRTSFDQTIRAFIEQLHKAKDNEEKYKIVLKVMQKITQLSTVNHEKGKMFHETVMAPLNTLYIVWNTLHEFINTARSMNIKEIEEVITHVLNNDLGASAGNMYDRIVTALGNKRMGYLKYLKTGNTFVVPGGGGVERKFSVVENVFYQDNVLVEFGTYGSLKDVTWDDFYTILAGDANQPEDQRKKNREAAVRFMVDREKMFKDLTNLSFSLGSDLGELVNIKVQQQSFFVEYGQLYELCGTLMKSIKKNLELFRGIIQHDVISKIESGSDMSIYKLEENLFERIFRDARIDYPGFNKLNEMLSHTFRSFSKKWTVLAKTSADAGAVAGAQHTRFVGPTEQKDNLNALLNQHETELLQDSFEHPMSKLLYWGRDIDRITTLHPLERARVNNTNVNEFPFSVIPPVENSASEDDSIKSLKSIQDAMKALQETIVKSVVDTGNRYGNVAYYDQIAQYFKSIAWSFFEYPDSTIRANSEIVGNYGVRYNKSHVGAMDINLLNDQITQIERQFPRFPQTIRNNIALKEPYLNNNNQYEILQAQPFQRVQLVNRDWAGLQERLNTLGDRYNALFTQRERIIQSSLSLPLTHRVKLYTDPSREDEGFEFMGRIDEGFETGLLVRFNEILSKYVYNGWDHTTKKIYTDLIRQFAASHTTAVNNGVALNDIDMDVGNTLHTVGVPQSHVTLFASLSRAIRNIMNNVRKTGIPEYRVDSLMELPIHMKETMRANLPHFEKLFKLVIKKAELLRQVSQYVSLVRQMPINKKYGVTHTDQAGAPGDQAGQFIWKYHGAANGAAHANNVIGYGAVNERYQHLGIDTSLLEKNDVIHVRTGFVVKNAPANLLQHATIAGIAPFNIHGLVPAADQNAWLRGSQTYAGNDRYSRWVQTACNHRSDRPGYLYVGYQPYHDLSLEKSRRWHIDMCTDIANSAGAVVKCISDSYKALSDVPHYLETHEGFITDYVNMNKQYPLMFLSQLQVALRPKWRLDNTVERNNGEYEPDTRQGYAYTNFMLPLYRSGETAFKLAYGSRAILGRPDLKPSLELMPGMTNLLDKYNGVSSGDTIIPKNIYETFTEAHAKLLRFVIDIKHFKSVLDTGSGGRFWKRTPHLLTDGNNIMLATVGGGGGYTPDVFRVEAGAALFDVPLNREAVDGQNTADIIPSPSYQLNDKMRSYPFRSTLDEVISITESSDQETTSKNIVAIVQDNPDPVSSRDEARIYNVLDLDIVMINPHALLREIPLINLINYSYTCDRMIQDALLPESELNHKGCLLQPSDEVGSTKMMLTKMMLYPYAKVSATEFNGYIARIATGDSGLDLGRPKFISDQLWNKMLLQELYPLPVAASNKPDESGPGAINAQRRLLENLTQPQLFGDMEHGRINELPFHNAVVAFPLDNARVNAYITLLQAQIPTLAPIGDNHAVRRAIESVFKYYRSYTGNFIAQAADGQLGAAAALAVAAYPGYAAIHNWYYNFRVALDAINAPGVVPGPYNVHATRAALQAAATAAFNAIDAAVPANSNLRNVLNGVIDRLTANNISLGNHAGLAGPALAAAQNALAALTTAEAKGIANSMLDLIHEVLDAALPDFMGIPKKQAPLERFKSLIGYIVKVAAVERLKNMKDVSVHSNNGSLKYPKADTDGNVTIGEVKFDSALTNGSHYRQELYNIGRQRFDTTFIRNMFFLINLQRVMRMVLRDEVSHLESPVVNSTDILNRQITEYESNEVYNYDVFQN